MRYLLYYDAGTVSDPVWDYVGIKHLSSQLQALCREAAWLGRTPVFPRIAPLARLHNDDIPCKFPLHKYLDTQNIELVCKLGGETRMLSLRSIHEEQLRELKIPADETLEIASRQPVTDSQNQRFRLLVRCCDFSLWRRKQGPLLVESFAHDSPPAHDLEQEKKNQVLQVILQSAPEVRELAADIIRQLPPNYCAVHIRRGDNLMLPAIRTLTSPRAVSRALTQAGVAPDVPLYLMSDEKSRHWLHTLRKQWPGLLHYTDFPRLVQLVHPPHGADNHFLFCVEQQILQHSTRVLLTRGGLLYGDTDQKPEEYIIPPFLYKMPVAKKIYHPVERKISFYRAQFEQTLWGPETSRRKSIILVKTAAAWCRTIMIYCGLRLFMPQKLQRYRNRRKALNTPA